MSEIDKSDKQSKTKVKATPKKYVFLIDHRVFGADYKKGDEFKGVELIIKKLLGKNVLKEVTEDK